VVPAVKGATGRIQDNFPFISSEGLTDGQVRRKTKDMSIASTSRRLVGNAVSIIIIL
jgi:hypothetical protein